MFGFKMIINAEQQLAHHRQPVKYDLSLPPDPVDKVKRKNLDILKK